MSSFYGNVKNLVRSPFIFDRIYSSRKKMEDSLLNGGDGVFINRYVLVNYGFDAEGAIYVAIDSKLVSNNPSDTSNETQYLVHSSNFRNYFVTNANDEYVVPTYWLPSDQKTYYYRTSYTSKWKENSTDGNNSLTDFYTNNRKEDLNRYNANFDLTVWMKVYTNNKELYICVSHLETVAPGILIDVAAAIDGENGSGAFIDQENSSSEFYIYTMPKSWNLVLNDYDPIEDSSSKVILYELESKTYPHEFDSTHEYPYINAAGFDEEIRTRVDNDNSISLNNACSGLQYAVYEYKPVYSITLDGYVKSTYYIRAMENAPSTFDSNLDYYTVSTKYIALENEPILLDDTIYKRRKDAFPVNEDTVLLCYYGENVDNNTYLYYKKNEYGTNIYSVVKKGAITSGNYNTVKQYLYIPKSNESYVRASGEYISNEKYYIKTKYSLIDNSQYVRDKYYYYDSSTDSFKLATTNTANSNTKYYALGEKYNYIIPTTPLPIATSETYLSYYVKNIDNDYELCNDDFNSTTLYFSKVKSTISAVREDTKRLDINLPVIGNAVSDLYDLIYGSPFSLKGYTNKSSTDYPAYTSGKIRCRIGDINGIDKGLTAELLLINDDNLSKVPTNNKTIPVYLINDYLLVGYSDTTISSNGIGDGNVYCVDTPNINNPITLETSSIKKEKSGSYTHPIYKILAFKLIGYTKSGWNSSVNNYNGKDKYSYKIGKYGNSSGLKGGNYSLTEAQLSDNSFIQASWSLTYDIPVYRYRQDDYRVYSIEEILNNLNVEPYNNILASDPISIGWALDEMKLYISELRHLADPENGGMSADWTLYKLPGAQHNPLGYIEMKPRMLWRNGNSTSAIVALDNNSNTKYSIEYIYTNYTKCYDNGNYSINLVKLFFGER